MNRLKTVLSLYVAIAVHTLLILLAALGGVAPQRPAGEGRGLGNGGEAPLSPGSDAGNHRIAETPGAFERPSLLTLAASPVSVLTAPVVAGEGGYARQVPTASAGDNLGIGGGRGGYLAEVRQQLDRNRRALPGVLGSARSEVAFVIDAAGAVSELRLVTASGIDALDTEATSVVRRAAPFPRPPDGIPRRLSVPISVDVPAR